MGEFEEIDEDFEIEGVDEFGASEGQTWVCAWREGAVIRGPWAEENCEHCTPYDGTCSCPLTLEDWKGEECDDDDENSVASKRRTPSPRGLTPHVSLRMPIPGRSEQPAYGSPKDTLRHESVHREDWGAPARESAQRGVGKERARDSQRELLESYEQAFDAHVDMQRDLDAREHGGIRHLHEPVVDQQAEILQAFEDSSEEGASPNPYAYPDISGRPGSVGPFDQADPFAPPGSVNPYAPPGHVDLFGVPEDELGFEGY